LYSRQLHAYAIALENAADGFTQLSPVSKLGLFVMEPYELQDLSDNEYGLMTKAEWIEIPRDDKKFKEFISEVVTLLGKQTPPKRTKGRLPWEGCQDCYWWCHKDRLDEY
jgi:hypothetical protein